MAEDIALYHDELKQVIYAKTEAQAAVYAESGWKKATKAQVEAASEEEGE